MKLTCVTAAFNVIAAEISPICHMSDKEGFAEELVAMRFRDLYGSRLV